VGGAAGEAVSVEVPVGLGSEGDIKSMEMNNVKAGKNNLLIALKDGKSKLNLPIEWISRGTALGTDKPIKNLAFKSVDGAVGGLVELSNGASFLNPAKGKVELSDGSVFYNIPAQPRLVRTVHSRPGTLFASLSSSRFLLEALWCFLLLLCVFPASPPLLNPSPSPRSRLGQAARVLSCGTASG
jgi:hypothetical protein